MSHRALPELPVPSTQRPTRHTLDGRMRKVPLAAAVLALAGCVDASRPGAGPRYLADAPVGPSPTTAPTAENSFTVKLPPHRFADALRPDSPFGINTALRPDAPDLEPRLRAMREAGVKWG